MRDLSRYIGKKKGVLEIVEIVESTENNKTSIAKCKCSRCNGYSNHYIGNFINSKDYAKFYCPKCKKDFLLERAKRKFIGLKNGVLECLDVIDSNSNPQRKIAICKCNVCGSITNVRVERLISKKHIPQSCENCVNEIYRKTTKERYYKKYNCSGKEYENKKHINYLIKRIIKNAESRNINYELSDEFTSKLLISNCYYCNDELSYGIDRLDSNKGYIKENCVPCCKICNIMKNKFDLNVFLDKINKIYNHFNNEGSTTIPKGSKSQAYGD